jgi:thymidylate kinase
MKQCIIELARNALAGNIPMLILRGGDEQARIGGDIDILVPSGESIRACQLIVEKAKQAGWHLAGFKDIGYVASIILLRPDINGDDDALKLDLISGLEWYAMGDGSITNKFFKLLNCYSNKQEPVAGLIAFATFIQKIMASGHLSKRDWSRVRDGVGHNEILLETADFIGVPLMEDDMDEKGIHRRRQWKLRAASAGVGGPIGFALWFPRVVLAHLRFKLGIGNHAGCVIGLSGLDGSGKSTQMDRLFAAFRKADCARPWLVHLLPEWIPMPHQLLRRNMTVQNYTKPYAEAAVKSKWNGLLRLTYYLLAFTVAKWWMRLSALRGRVILLDRSFVDFAADLTRARIPDFHLPPWLIRLCAPKGALIYLDASPGSVVKRKGELTLEKATQLHGRYLTVFQQIDGVVVDAEVPQEIVFQRVLECIDSVYVGRLKAAARA